MEKRFDIPEPVRAVMEKLRAGGFEAYAVGGCVRDLLRAESPKDWDVTTSAKPEEISALFPESFYENKFLTVTVKTGSDDPALKEIEVTTYRTEGKYADQRHPEEVKPAKTLAEDLARRDFAMNAIALDLEGNITDPFGGGRDIEAKTIRAVGNPDERFAEDALRMLRAARLSTELGFSIESATSQAVRKNASSLAAISKERARDEFVKIINSGRPKEGLELLRELGLLKHILPELEEGVGIEQRGPHKYDVWEHNLRALDYAAAQGWPLRVRLAALLHDIAKPRTRERRGGIWTFYGHDMAGAKMTEEILPRLRFGADETAKIAALVRWHLFSYKLPRDEEYLRDLAAMGENPKEKDIEDAEDMQETTDSAIRRLIRRVGEDLIHDLVKVRICDRVATGVPKAVPYRLRHFQFRVEKILREGEATNVRMLKVNGGDVMERLGIGPGPRIGHILNALLEEALDEPHKNERKYLLERMEELNRLPDEELALLRERSEGKVEEMEKAREGEIKKKYRVK